MRRLLLVGTAAVTLFVAPGLRTAGALPQPLQSPTPSPSPTGKAATSIEVSISAKVVDYGEKLAVTTLLQSERDVGGAEVEVFGKPIGQKKISLGSFAVNDEGVFVGEIQMYSGTIFSAVFNGSPTLKASTSNEVTGKVRVILDTTLSGHYDKAQGRKLFHSGDEAFLATRVNPAHEGKNVVIVLQREVDGEWKLVKKAEFQMDEQGLAAGSVLLTTRGLYRTRAVFAGDADHIGAASRWRELLVTA